MATSRSVVFISGKIRKEGKLSGKFSKRHVEVSGRTGKVGGQEWLWLVRWALALYTHACTLADTDPHTTHIHAHTHTRACWFGHAQLDHTPTFFIPRCNMQVIPGFMLYSQFFRPGKARIALAGATLHTDPKNDKRFLVRVPDRPNPSRPDKTLPIQEFRFEADTTASRDQWLRALAQALHPNNVLMQGAAAGGTAAALPPPPRPVSTQPVHPTTAAAAPPTLQRFGVVIPPSTQPGQSFLFNAMGRTFSTVCPPGKKPGEQVEVHLHALSAAPPAAQISAQPPASAYPTYPPTLAVTAAAAAPVPAAAAAAAELQQRRSMPTQGRPPLVRVRARPVVSAGTSPTNTVTKGALAGAVGGVADVCQTQIFPPCTAFRCAVAAPGPARVCASVRARACACVRGCVRACVRVCVRARACVCSVCVCLCVRACVCACSCRRTRVRDCARARLGGAVYAS
jgi:hypothetical protein